MRIAILTQPLHNNYGGILQNYALQYVLKKMGHSPVTLDIPYEEPKWNLFQRVPRIIWRTIKKLNGDQSVVYCDPKKQWFLMNQPGTSQKLFISKHVDLIRLPGPLDSSFCNTNAYDAYIVGSDQVWRPRFSPCLGNFFLDFTQNVRVLRIAYAASFGTDRWEGTAEQAAKFMPLLRRFSSIGVREISGVSICNNTFGIDSVCNLDPTLLISSQVYERLFVHKTSPQKKPYLAIYALDITKGIERIISKICEEKGLIPFFIGRCSKRGFPSVESWLEGIYFSDYVLTDSYHGTIFSVLFHKPFTTIINSGRGASRFDSLLCSLGLSSRLTAESNFDIQSEPVEYTRVDELLLELRNQSLLFLDEALSRTA